MEWIIIGIIIGLMMGLTGSGGALVAIPLFMSLLDKSLKEASVLSLYVVILASFINYYSQRKNTQYRLSIMVFIGSVVGSFLVKPLKALSPDFVIAILLGVISVFSVFSIWKKGTHSKDDLPHVNNYKSVGLGLLLGGLTTMTGLGGGVLLMPIFLGTFKLSENRAVATSLITITFSSLISLLLQINELETTPGWRDLAFIIIGVTGSLFLLKILLSHISQNNLSLMRKFVFTVLVIYSLFKIF